MKPSASRPLFLAAALLGLAATSAPAQFTGGNLAVLRAGNGSQSLVSSGNTLFVDQYTPAGAYVNSVPIPDSGGSALIISGVAASQGGVSRSLDRSVLVLAGFNTNRASISSSLSSATGAQVARGFGTIDATGAFVLRAARPDIFSALNFRCATGDGTNLFWLAGAGSGTLCLQPPAGAPAAVQTAEANTGYVKAIAGNLWFTTQSGAPGLYEMNGLPATVGAGGTPALVINTGATAGTAGFDVNAAGTLAYLADQRATGSGGGVQKWVNGTAGWTNVYTLTNNLGPSGAFSVAVDFSGTNPVVYATSGDTNANALISFVDTNAAAAGRLLARAATNTVFRGVDFGPDLRPLITTQPQSQSVVAGAAVTFGVTATATTALTYQWLRSGTNLTGANASTLALTGVTAAQAAPYQVVVSSYSGSVTSAVATLTVTTSAQAPAITTQPVGVTNFAGGNATFTAAASGTAPLYLQWQSYNTNLPGQTNASLALTNLAVSQSGPYRFLAVNSAGGATSQVAYLQVQPVAPAVTLQPVTQTVLAGTTVTFTTTLSGTAPFQLRWTHNNLPISDGGEFSGTGTPTLTISNAQAADYGLYYLTVTNAAGGTLSAPADLYIVVPAPPSFIPYTAAGSVYSQNFDTLPNAGTNSVNADNPVTINGTTFGLTAPFDFAAPVNANAGFGGLGLSNSLAGWYGLGTVLAKFGASAGDQSTGGVIGFGPTNSAATNRALGLLATSSTGGTAFGAKFINATSNALTGITLHFTGELWRQQPAPKTLAFGYLLDPTATLAFSTNVTAWVTNLNVTFPTGPFAVLDGTQATNQTSLGATNLAIPAWPGGGALWLVWQMPDNTAASQGLAIDNLTFSAQAAAAPQLSIARAGANVLLSWPVAAGSYHVQQRASLLKGTVWQNAAQSVVTNGASATVTVPLGAGAQYFRLSQ